MNYINIILVLLIVSLLSSFGGNPSPTTTSNNLTGAFADADVDGIAYTSTKTIGGQAHQRRLHYIANNHANYFNNGVTKTNDYRAPTFEGTTGTTGGTLTWIIYGLDATHTREMQEHIIFMANRLSNENGLTRSTRLFDKLFVIQVAVKPYFNTTTSISGANNDILTVTKSATNSCVYDIILEHALAVQTNFFTPPATAIIDLKGDGAVAADAIFTSAACKTDTTVLGLITDAVNDAKTVVHTMPDISSHHDSHH